jgi:predicted molibdopterin-dependent oxidoreductase YjgC
MTANEGAMVTLSVDGEPVRATSGMSVAAALLSADIHAFRRSVTGEPRAPLCGMGVCYECRVTIDGLPHQRACLLIATDGMDVRTGMA